MSLLPTPTSKEQDCRTPIDKLEAVEKIPDRILERGNTPLDKCNQIVETIGILSEINSSPVGNRAKSI